MSTLCSKSSTTMVTKRLEHSSSEQKLRGGTVQPGEERAQQDPVNMFNYLLGREQRASIHALLHGTQGQNQRHKTQTETQENMFKHNRKTPLTVRVVEHGNRLWNLHPWWYSKPNWTQSCVTCCGWPWLSRAWTLCSPEVPPAGTTASLPHLKAR